MARCSYFCCWKNDNGSCWGCEIVVLFTFCSDFFEGEWKIIICINLSPVWLTLGKWTKKNVARTIYDEYSWHLCPLSVELLPIWDKKESIGWWWWWWWWWCWLLVMALGASKLHSENNHWTFVMVTKIALFAGLSREHSWDILQLFKRKKSVECVWIELMEQRVEKILELLEI